MSETKAALPCLACGTPLMQACPGEGVTNQPNDGVCAITHGNYGSTVFDSIMSDSVLLFSICDACLVKAAEQERVLWLQTSRPVYAHFDGERFRREVGREMLDRPAIPWQPGKGWEQHGESIEVEPEDVGTKMGAVQWRPDATAPVAPAHTEGAS